VLIETFVKSQRADGQHGCASDRTGSHLRPQHLYSGALQKNSPDGLNKLPYRIHIRDPVNCFRHIAGGKGVPAIAVCLAFPFRFALYSVMLAKPALRHVILASVPTLMARDLIVWALFFALPRHLI
jgi:hypothetical protein